MNAGALSFIAHAGRNRIAFAGRLSAGHRLPLGRYTVTFRASAGGHASAARTLRFAVVR